MTSAGSSVVPIYVHTSKLSQYIDRDQRNNRKNHKSSDFNKNGDSDSVPYEWVRGTLISETDDDHGNGRICSVELESKYYTKRRVNVSINENDVYEECILRANPASSKLEEDLVHLTHLHEPAVVETLFSRYEQNLIYTATGPILLALNPCKLCIHSSIRD